MIQLTPKLAVREPVKVEAKPVSDTSWLEVNLARLDHNVECFRNILHTPDRFSDKRPMLCGVVKSNAYGMGAVHIAQRLAAHGVDMIATYSTHQAEELVRNAVKCPILLLMPLREMTRNHGLYRAGVAGQLHLTIHDPQQIEQINQFCQMLGMRMPVHLHLDTGMSRSGLNEREAEDILLKLPDLRHVQLEGIYSHIASAMSNESFAREQNERFENFLSQHREHIPDDTIIHIANTYASLRDRRFHHGMVRVGLGLYGYGPDLLTSGSIVPDIEQLQPVARWLSRIIHVARFPKHAKVGYDASYKLWRDSVLGVIPVGYGDGYPLALGNKGVVTLPDLRSGPDHITANVLGKINMDQIVVDLTEIATALENKGRRQSDANADIAEILRSTTIELISDDPASPCALPKVAATAGTSCYELMCRLAESLPRCYITPDNRINPNPATSLH